MLEWKTTMVDCRTPSDDIYVYLNSPRDESFKRGLVLLKYNNNIKIQQSEGVLVIANTMMAYRWHFNRKLYYYYKNHSLVLILPNKHSNYNLIITTWLRHIVYIYHRKNKQDQVKHEMLRARRGLHFAYHNDSAPAEVVINDFNWSDYVCIGNYFI